MENNEQEALQEVFKAEEKETNSISSEFTSSTLENSSVDLSNFNEEFYSNNSGEEQKIESIIQDVPVFSSPDTPISSSQEVVFDTTIIEEKLSDIVALENSQIIITLIFFGLISAIIILFVLYRFISNFFEF